MEDGKMTRLYAVIIFDEIKSNTSYKKKTTIKELAQKLADFCDHKVSRSDERTVERHLECLKSLYGDNIVIETKSNEEYNPEKPSDIAFIYYDRMTVEENDVNLLSDAVVYSKHLASKERQRLLKNISSLFPSSDNKWARSLCTEADEMWNEPSDQLYRNLEYITEAIKEKKCISFDVNVYKKSKRLEKNGFHQGFSPYKVYWDNGIYYVVGAALCEKLNTLRFKENHPAFEQKCTIVRFEVFRMSHVKMDDENVYFSQKEAGYANISMKDILFGDFDIYNRLSKTRNPDERAELIVNDRGLHVLLSYFKEKAKVEEVPANYRHYKDDVVVNNKETLFYVTLRRITRSEWYQLVSLLYQYPVKDISLIYPNDKLKVIIKSLSAHLDVKDIGNRKVEKRS